MQWNQFDIQNEEPIDEDDSSETESLDSKDALNYRSNAPSPEKTNTDVVNF